MCDNFVLYDFSTCDKIFNIMQIVLAATIICYALATFFRVREKVVGSRMKNHSKISFIIGLILNVILFYLTVSSENGNSQLETASLLEAASLTLAACTLFVELGLKENYLSIFSLPVCITILVLSLLVSGSIEGAQFSQTWFIAHLISSIAGECFFLIAAISSASYLFVVRRLKKKNRLKAVFLFPPLSRLDNLTYRLIVAGTITFALGLLLGLYGNYEHFYAFKPAFKHYYSIIVLIYYLILCLFKYKLKLTGPRLANAALIGFILSIGLILIPDNSLHWKPVSIPTINQTGVSK
ncbi:MAG: cytochrome c biogenesis protein CcsA [Candidatus Rifleibacteriota bacterium]